MNRYITLGVTLVVGIGIGAAVVQGLHAQTKRPALQRYRPREAVGRSKK